MVYLLLFATYYMLKGIIFYLNMRLLYCPNRFAITSDIFNSSLVVRCLHLIVDIGSLVGTSANLITRINLSCNYLKMFTIIIIWKSLKGNRPQQVHDNTYLTHVKAMSLSGLFLRSCDGHFLYSKDLKQTVFAHTCSYRLFKSTWVSHRWLLPNRRRRKQVPEGS